ncbi:hypothetical protein FF041_05590 [Streptomyces jumonjinensis]|uniref:Uncharacterized protein n=1 Tax=Streptomyces jumonjinensis TaxID=1945 RepID=A0A646KBS8_STRJU|nr:hypothetical protein [Streptomyces jumonjinensis]
MSRHRRSWAEAAARSELARVVGFVGRAYAPQVLADRVARRLEEQMRLAGPIKDPVGWPSWPQRQRCGDVRCADRSRTPPRTSAVRRPRGGCTRT